MLSQIEKNKIDRLTIAAERDRTTVTLDAYLVRELLNNYGIDRDAENTIAGLREELDKKGNK